MLRSRAVVLLVAAPVLAVAAAFGARTELAIGEPDPSGDAGLPVATCTPVWDACRISVPPMLVSGRDLGQSPDVVWADDRLLVVYDSDAGNTLVATTIDGEEISRDELRGTQDPRIAWSSVTHTGVAVMDTLIRWLGDDGRPRGAGVRPEVDHQMAADVAAVEGGFALLTGVNAYSSPPPLYAAFLPPAPVDAIELTAVTEPAPYSPAEHATDDRGLGLFAVSTVWSSGDGAIYRLDGSGPPARERTLSVPGAFRPLGVVQREGARWLFYASVAPTFAHYLTDLDTGHTRLVAENVSGADGHLERLGGDAIAAFRFAPAPGELERVVIARVDLATTPVIGSSFDLSEPGRIGHSARITPTPRGLAVTWSEDTGDHEDGLSARLAVLECCP
jgi:hypothetical protein